MISQWKKDELREQLKGVKKSVDDADKAAKALLIQKVILLLLRSDIILILIYVIMYIV